MGLTDLLFRRSEPRWMNQEPLPSGYGGNSPRTEIRCIMCCNKCEEKVLEEIAEVPGVQDVVTDQARSEVVVYGYADTHDVLKKARKIDRRADILSSDSFTLHHSKRSHSHNNIHYKHSMYDKHSRSQFSDYSHGHGYSGRGTRMPIDQSVGSPRYNSSFNQFRHGSGGGGYGYGAPEYQPSYRPREQEFRHGHDRYRAEPEYRRHHVDMYRPQSEFRGRYDDRWPEHEDRYQHSAYRPSQSYPPSYVEEGDCREYPYPEMVNPDYMKPVDYYY